MKYIAKTLGLATTVVLLFLSSLVSAETTHVSDDSMRNSYPYNISHYLQVNVGGSNKKSSAALVAPNLLLTAAHGIADNATGQVTAQTTSGVAVWGDASPYYEASQITKTSYSNPFIVMPGYTGNRDVKRDIALVKIAQASNKTQQIDTNQVRMAVYTNLRSLVGKQFTIVSNSLNLWGRWEYEVGTITGVRSDGLVTTNIKGVNGQSGSPIVVDGEIVGVATNIENATSNILFTPLTNDIYNNLLAPNGIYNVNFY
ncbi:trypsin-like serine peptidase [Streptococcus saliviloxodontae]|uniref:Protease YdgD n=1 Tax=Streptococcus saliviloxodontae TaxID=1349416 RepID=A0ABS2PIN5_9STRE|nr:trypsin-like serine protease [Streptococcus saliviloxodontae]MBM7635287.1 protease YdgD [Streptococcus saliviloxodontae]